MTVGDALVRGRAVLSRADSAVGGGTPGLDTEVLLRHVLGIDRAGLLAHPERVLTEAQRQRYRRLLRRRAAGEPVAYLTGRREFMGHSFVVDARVLVPRPETELLVERALAHLPPVQAALAPQGPPKCNVQSGCGPANGAAPRVVDVGTGSGAIAVSLAAAWPAVRVVATDVSAEALAVARRNARRVLGPGWWRRVRFRHGSLLEPVRGPVDLIAANLPYVRSEEMAGLPVSVRRFEPALALDGGGDGLEAYRELLRQAPGKVRPGGVVLMECDPRQADELAALARAAHPGGTVTVRRDLAGRERVVEVVTGE